MGILYHSFGALSTKIEVALLSSNFKVQKAKYHYLSLFEALGLRYGNFLIFTKDYLQIMSVVKSLSRSLLFIIWSTWAEIWLFSYFQNIIWNKSPIDIWKCQISDKEPQIRKNECTHIFVFEAQGAVNISAQEPQTKKKFMLLSWTLNLPSIVFICGWDMAISLLSEHHLQGISISENGHITFQEP